MSDVFSLKAYWFHIRKPTARVDSPAGSVELYLPAYFGRHRWRLEASGLAVVDLAMVGDGSIASGTVFATPPLVPYFFTTGPGTTPTTGLLFVHPQRVPPIRPVAAWAPNTDVPIGVLESRSKTGADIDGLLLRFDDLPGSLRRSCEPERSRPRTPTSGSRDTGRSCLTRMKPGPPTFATAA